VRATAWEAGAVEDVEFRPGPRYRNWLLVRATVGLVLGFAFLAVARGQGTLDLIALVPLAYAACCLVGWARRGMMSTRLTSQGIAIRGYRSRFVPWQDITAVEVVSYDRAQSIAVASARTRRSSTAARRSRTRKVATVQIVRANGRRIELSAPLVTGIQEDPDFDDKARLIQARWRQAVTPETGTPVRRAYPSNGAVRRYLGCCTSATFLHHTGVGHGLALIARQEPIISIPDAIAAKKSLTGYSQASPPVLEYRPIINRPSFRKISAGMSMTLSRRT
jgi:hypothetical protein